MSSPFKMRDDCGIQDLKQLCVCLPVSVVMVEIGTYTGESAELFIKSGKVCEIHCVDPWENGYDSKDIASFICPMSEVELQFDMRMQTLKHLPVKIQKLKQTSIVAALAFENSSLDFVYVDGNHTYDAVSLDLRTWYPKIKQGGFIGGHDYGDSAYAGVTKAVNELVTIPDKQFCAGSWLYQKR